MKRFLAVLLAVLLAIGLTPTAASAQSGDAAEVPYEVRHPQAVEIWDSIEKIEHETAAKPNISFADALETIFALVESSETTKPGSIERHGEAFLWDTVDGAACGYNPAFRERIAKRAGTSGQIRVQEPDETVSPSVAGGKNVAVFQPYFGVDPDFTDRYVNEGSSIANVLGGACAVYRTTTATIDKVANAIRSCAVVIFDSYGDTDYSNGDDCVSEANTSYLCLQNGSGITNEEMQYVMGTYGRYKHAYYAGTYHNAACYMVDGTVIANHMDGDAPDSLLWMAIQLGMATDGLFAPLREKGVQTVYGYSQSASVEGDHQYEESFFYAMKQGATVASAVSFMKREGGSWDPAYASYTQTEAVSNRVAFPIVVSDEDRYPGQGSVDKPQTVLGKGRILNTGLLYGDVDGDGRVGVTDASLLLRSVSGAAELTRIQFIRSDVKPDGAVDASDASAILRRITELIDRFAAEP